MHLAAAASVLGITTHLAFHRFEPKTTAIPGCILLIEPGALILALSGYHGATVGATAAVYAVFFLSLALSIVSYRLSPLHPLAQFPGPAINKVSKLWGVWVQWRGHRHLVLKDLHDKYGPCVRTGPNEVSIVDLDAVTSVLGVGGLPKGSYYDARKVPGAPDVLILMVGDAHVHRRRLWNRGMNTQSIKEYEVFLVKRAEQLHARLADLSGSAVDMAEWLGFFSFDFVGDMAFGGGFDMLRDGGDASGTWRMIESAMAALAMLCHVPWAAPVIQRNSFLSHDVKRMRKFGADCATSRLKAGASVKDLWYHLTDEAGLEKTKPPLSDVVADGVLAIVAGADTTATAITCLLYLLLTHPDAYKRLQAEVDAVFPKGENALDVSKHSSMPYLTACLNETLRMHPVVPVNGPRLVTPGSGGKLVAGWLVPEGTQVYVPPYVFHHDPRYFSPSPDKFRPERWCDEPPAPGPSAHNTAAFFPFSHGPANCVGQGLARREMALVVSLLLQRFELRFADGFSADGWAHGLHDHWITKKPTLPLVVTVRG